MMIVTIKYDEDCEMMEILKGGESIFHGNYWDFDRSPNGIKEFLEELGHKVKLVKEDMSEG